MDAYVPLEYWQHRPHPHDVTTQEENKHQSTENLVNANDTQAFVQSYFIHYCMVFKVIYRKIL